MYDGFFAASLGSTSVTEEFLRHKPIDVVALGTQIDVTRAQLEQAVSLDEPKQILEHAGALVAMLTAARQESEAFSLGHRHVALARRYTTLEESAWLLHGLATAAQYFGERTQANALFSEALESARFHGWRRLEHFVLHHWGRSQAEEGALQAAERCFVESRAIRIQIDAALVASSDRALSELAKLPAMSEKKCK